MNCRIMDDQYWEKIYSELSNIFSFYYPIKKNIKSPIAFIDKIQNWDLILLDNYFPWKDWEEPLWDFFLWEYLNKWLKCDIICISDFWKSLIDKYYNWEETNNKWDIKWWCPSKEADDISEIIKSIIKQD